MWFEAVHGGVNISCPFRALGLGCVSVDYDWWPVTRPWITRPSHSQQPRPLIPSPPPPHHPHISPSPSINHRPTRVIPAHRRYQTFAHGKNATAVRHSRAARLTPSSPGRRSSCVTARMLHPATITSQKGPHLPVNASSPEIGGAGGERSG